MAEDCCGECEEEPLSPQPPLCLPDTGSCVSKLTILLGKTEAAQLTRLTWEFGSHLLLPKHAPCGSCSLPTLRDLSKHSSATLKWSPKSRSGACSLLHPVLFLVLWRPLQTGILHSGHLACPGSGFAWTVPLLLAGDVHIAIMDRNGQLEVEVIEARGLTPKPGSKSLPGKAEHLGEGFWKWGPAREGV